MVEPSVDIADWARDYESGRPDAAEPPPDPFPIYRRAAVVIALATATWAEAGEGHRVAAADPFSEPWLDATSRFACTLRSCSSDCIAVLEEVRMHVKCATIPGPQPVEVASVGCQDDRTYAYDVHVWPPHADLRR